MECVLKVFDAGVAATADALRGALLQNCGHERSTSRIHAARRAVWSNPRTARNRTKDWCSCNDALSKRELLLISLDWEMA